MPFTDHEVAEHIATIERVLWSRRRPALHLRPKVREGQRFHGYAIELFFVRPRYDNPREYVENPFAKVRFIRSRDVCVCSGNARTSNGMAISRCPKPPLSRPPSRSWTKTPTIVSSVKRASGSAAGRFFEAQLLALHRARRTRVQSKTCRHRSISPTSVDRPICPHWRTWTVELSCHSISRLS